MRAKVVHRSLALNSSQAKVDLSLFLNELRLASQASNHQAKDVHRSCEAAKVDSNCGCHSLWRVDPGSSFPSTSLGNGLAVRLEMALAKRFVYVLRSQGAPNRYYTGVTSDVHARLADHNAGRCRHTADGRPWQMDVVIEFSDQQRALAFEQYLKSGSGVAFAKRHLRTPPAHPDPAWEI